MQDASCLSERGTDRHRCAANGTDRFSQGSGAAGRRASQRDSGMATVRRVLANDPTGTKTAPKSTTAERGARVYGTPYGYGRAAHGAHATQRSERSLRPAAGAPRLQGQRGETTRTSTAWAYVAGQPKAVVGPTHSRGICTYPTRTVPHDHSTSITNPVKRAEIMELRDSRVSGYDTRFHKMGWTAMEQAIRDRECASGSRVQAEIDAQARADAPDGHGLTLLKSSARELVDILRKGTLRAGYHLCTCASLGRRNRKSRTAYSHRTPVCRAGFGRGHDCPRGDLASAPRVEA